MNTWLSKRMTVATWEFSRYFRLKDQMVGLFSMFLGAAVAFGAGKLAKTSSEVKLAVIGDADGLVFPDEGKMKIVSTPERPLTEEQWKEQLENREIDGLLIITKNRSVGDGSIPANNSNSIINISWEARLIVRQEPTWLSTLQTALQTDRMQTEMEAAAISPTTLAKVLQPAQVEVVAIADRGISAGDRYTAMALLGATLVTSWIGLAYMLVGITSEKQQRVTEQIVSAISPNAWMDGKLLGITAAAIGSLAFIGVTGIVTWPIAKLLGYEIALPSSLNRWELLPIFAFYYVGGVLLWNCFYGSVAAIISDPNTSSRTGLLFLPMLPMFAAGLVLSQPDGTMMQALSLIPGTSATAMPIRLVLGEVTTFEMMQSLTYMLLGIALMRLIAVRIFSAGIMLHGKEPSWIDIASWVVGYRSATAVRA